MARRDEIQESSFSSDWIDSSLSPFLISKEQFDSHTPALIECMFLDGVSRLAIVSELCYNGCLMVFLQKEISWPFPTVKKGFSDFFNV